MTGKFPYLATIYQEMFSMQIPGYNLYDKDRCIYLAPICFIYRPQKKGRFVSGLFIIDALIA